MTTVSITFGGFWLEINTDEYGERAGIQVWTMDEAAEKQLVVGYIDIAETEKNGVQKLEMSIEKKGRGKAVHVEFKR